MLVLVVLEQLSLLPYYCYCYYTTTLYNFNTVYVCMHDQVRRRTWSAAAREYATRPPDNAAALRDSAPAMATGTLLESEGTARSLIDCIPRRVNNK